MDRLGIDIGSKTLKLMLLDEDGRELFSWYEKHRGRISELLRECIRNAIWRVGDRDVRISVAGSSGMRLAEMFDIPFVQEVVALKRAVQSAYPEADAVLEMGGEDTKLVYLSGVPEQRMNNICAGGTGSFIEMMSGLMGERTMSIDRLAKGHTTIYPIASRCAVFAKSDVRPLLNAGARVEDIAASILDAVCTQAVAGLSAGRPLSGTVILLGGPFHYISSLRDSFCRVTGFDRAHAIVPEDAHLFVARGAALSMRASEPMRLTDFEKMLERTEFESTEGIGRLRPLFDTEKELQAFRDRHGQCRVPRVTWMDADADLFVGLDVGSTTAKIAVIDSTGAIVGFDHHRHRGDVVGSVTRMMNRVLQRVNARYSAPRTIRRSCAVGYGEQLCRVAFGVDEGEVETVAHLRAAKAIDPQVDFLMDIGGQDVKCFYVRDGMIQDVVLNEACSSGCGSLFDSVSNNLNKNRRDFVAEAMRAKAPVDLGTRCTTFMNSRIRHAQKEGASSEDIAAGVCYATARNALFKVVRQPDFSKVGSHIVVQGGAFANDALLRAFELETGVEVRRPDLAPVMAAWGAALLARDEWLSLRQKDPKAADQMVSGLLSLDEVNNMDVDKKVIRCEGCTNCCKLRVARFARREEDATKRMLHGDFVAGTERILVTGNRCERGALINGAVAEKRSAPPNLLRYKRSLLASYCSHGQRLAAEKGKASLLVGIPKSLALYESYPFWKTFFDELGVEVLDCAEPDDEVFKEGMACIPAESMCYPAKMIFGQAVDLARRGADALFVPAVTTAFARYGLAGHPMDGRQRTCPLVENMGAMIAGNAEGSPLEGLQIITLDLTDATALADIGAPIMASLAELGVNVVPEQMERALQAASREYRSFLDALLKRTSEVLAEVDAGAYPGIILIDHGYHCAEGISRNVDELIGEAGYAVLEQIGSSSTNTCASRVAKSVRDAGWFENVSAYERVAGCADHPNLQPVILRSFGCGIDALAADDLRDRLKEAGHVYVELKIDQIADLAAMRIRLRSLAYAHRQREGASRVYDLTAPPDAYRERAAYPMQYEQRQRMREAKVAKASPRPDSAVSTEHTHDQVPHRAQAASDAHAGTSEVPSWLAWSGQGPTASNVVFGDAIHVSIVAPQGYSIEFDTDIPSDLPKPGEGGGHVGPAVSGNRAVTSTLKPRKVPYAHKYLGLTEIAGHTLHRGFSSAEDPLNPDPALERAPRPDNYAGATKPNYGPDYGKGR